MPSFKELGLSGPLLEAVSRMGFEATTPIQEQTIPMALEGRDLIGQAQTGTGKTAAFGIPLVEKSCAEAGDVDGLVVAPTRELAVQVAEEINSLGSHKGVRALPIYGGQDIGRQIRALKKNPQIIVGTPGRIMDHMRRRTLRLEGVARVILDEADEMLNMGFIEDIEVILEGIPAERQTLLFSATIPRAIQELARRFMRNPEFVRVKTKGVTVSSTEQYFLEVQERQKFEVLCRLLDAQSPDLALVFGRTKRRVDELFEALGRRGYSTEGIHGDMTQVKRDSVMHRFRTGQVDILVATDVAARGLDISGISHIYNFDVPQDPENYVHRIGRTGRLGKTGTAITLVTPREVEHLKLIEKGIKRSIFRQPVPTLDDARESQQRLAGEKLVRAAEEEDTRRYRELAEALLEEKDSVSLVSAALKILTKEPDETPVKLTDEAPMVKRQKPRQGPGAPKASSWNRQKGKDSRNSRRRRHP